MAFDEPKLFVIYRHTPKHPEAVVVRRFDLVSDGTGGAVGKQRGDDKVFTSLDKARGWLQRVHPDLEKTTRIDTDHFTVVESWTTWTPIATMPLLSIPVQRT
jgi:hypothetical protein